MVEACPDPVVLLDVDPGDLVPERTQPLPERAIAASEVQDPTRRPAREVAQDSSVNALVILEELLILGREGGLAAPEPELVGAVTQRVDRAVLRVTEAVHVADLVPIEGGDRQFHDALPRLVKLDNDLAVEVIIVGVALEGYILERG